MVARCSTRAKCVLDGSSSEKSCTRQSWGSESVYSLTVTRQVRCSSSSAGEGLPSGVSVSEAPWSSSRIAVKHTPTSRSSSCGRIWRGVSIPTMRAGCSVFTSDCRYMFSATLPPPSGSIRTRGRRSQPRSDGLDND